MSSCVHVCQVVTNFVIFVMFCQVVSSCVKRSQKETKGAERSKKKLKGPKRSKQESTGAKGSQRKPRKPTVVKSRQMEP